MSATQTLAKRRFFGAAKLARGPARVNEGPLERFNAALATARLNQLRP